MAGAAFCDGQCVQAAIASGLAESLWLVVR
jgi:hypothetical protein